MYYDARDGLFNCEARDTKLLPYPLPNPAEMNYDTRDELFDCEARDKKLLPFPAKPGRNAF
jgi:hypothetical protein